MNRKLGTRDLAVIYGVYDKLMKKIIAAKAINSSTKGACMFMESNQEHNTTSIPIIL